jgi:hypothetical protein|tara:strand:- start:225 stop:413 length:189 start_codon:yes stop_codon:yes gene_type:complete
MVNKALSNIDTDRENDDAIANSLNFVRTDDERMAQVKKESTNGWKGNSMLGPQPPVKKNDLA